MNDVALKFILIQPLPKYFFILFSTKSYTHLGKGHQCGVQYYSNPNDVTGPPSPPYIDPRSFSYDPS
jgi:hypothetical protein